MFKVSLLYHKKREIEEIKPLQNMCIKKKELPNYFIRLIKQFQWIVNKKF